MTSGRYLYRVDRLTPSRLATPDSVFSGVRSSSPTSDSCCGVSAGGRPSRFPGVSATVQVLQPVGDQTPGPDTTVIGMP